MSLSEPLPNRMIVNDCHVELLTLSHFMTKRSTTTKSHDDNDYMSSTGNEDHKGSGSSGSNGGSGGADDDDNCCHLEWIAYKHHRVLTVIFHLLCIVSLGVLFLLSHWYPKLKLWMTHVRCRTTMMMMSTMATARRRTLLSRQSTGEDDDVDGDVSGNDDASNNFVNGTSGGVVENFAQCDMVLVTNKGHGSSGSSAGGSAGNAGEYEMCAVREKFVFLNDRIGGRNEKPTMVRFVYYRRQCFIYDEETNRFVARKMFDHNVRLHEWRQVIHLRESEDGENVEDNNSTNDQLLDFGATSRRSSTVNRSESSEEEEEASEHKTDESLLRMMRMTTAKDRESNSAHQRALLKVFYGANSTEIPVKNIIYLLLDEILNPFYMFQIASVIIWMIDEYYYYSTLILVSSIISVVTSLVETRSNLVTLHEMSMSRDIVEVMRDGSRVRTTSTDQLVPGDVVIVKDGMQFSCDMVLVSGQCLVDESMLTGESVPVMKTPVPEGSSPLSQSIYDPKTHSYHTLFSGTRVIQTSTSSSSQRPVLAVCSKTGFDTTKGQILLSILYPTTRNFSFYRDSFIFIGIMSLIGIAGVIFSLVRLARMNVPTNLLILRALDVITIVVPPALPMAMTVGISFAVWRLKRKQIYCISPTKVNVAGKLTCMCFDKTGTLTEPGVELVGVWPRGSHSFDLISDEALLETLATMGDNGRQFSRTMLSCHNLVHLNNVLVGDPMEIKIFEAVRGQLANANDHSPHAIVQTNVHDDSDKIELKIVERFEFQSSLQRMSVIAQCQSTNKTYLLTKGSPEMIYQLADRSTTPDDYNDILHNFVSKGYRVIAVASRELSSFESNATREDLERGLSFHGFIIFQNHLKLGTRESIRELKNVHINTVMITGDNTHTALAVARHCDIIDSTHPVFVSHVPTPGNGNSSGDIEWINADSRQVIDTESLLNDQDSRVEVVISGSAFDILLDQRKYDTHHGSGNFISNLQKLLLRCHVYARMSPDQKMKVVEQLQKMDYSVGFCGDGFNDNKALSGSDVGVSLSEVETGMSAPFTSLQPTIACIPKIIREGRAALTLSFQLFKFMSCYSFIQFFAVLLLYRINSDLGDWQFLFIDVIIIMPVVFLTSYTEPIERLTRRKPSGSLLSAATFVSMIFQLVISLGLQALVLVYLSYQSWFTPLDPLPNSKKNVLCAESTSVFLMACYQTIGSAIAFSISKPFKRPLYTNVPYLFSLIVLSLSTVYITFAPDRWTRRVLQLELLPFHYQFLIMCLGLVQIIIFYVFESVLVGRGPRKLISKMDVRKHLSGEKLYKLVQRDSSSQIKND